MSDILKCLKELIGDKNKPDGSSKTHPCTNCKAVNSDSLKIHIEDMHRVNVKYPCEECNLQFDSIADMRNHSKIHKKDFDCN